MWHLSWKLQPTYLSQAGNSCPRSTAWWKGAAAEGHNPRGHNPRPRQALCSSFQEGQADTAGLLHWLCPDLRSRNCRSSLLTDSNCQGHKTELFLFSSRHTKVVGVGFPQAPSSVSWEHPCHPASPQSHLKRGATPTETHFQLCKSTGVAQTSSSHLRNAPPKFPRKAAAIPQVASSSTQGDISPTEHFHSP